MKNDIVQLVFSLLVLVFAGAAEELFPKFLGVGFPFLLMSSIYLAPRRSTLAAILFAVFAGAFADGISSLPLATSICFFTLASFIVRTPEISYWAMGFIYPIYIVWVWVWRPLAEGGVFGHVLMACLLGPLTALITFCALLWLERRAAL